MTGICLVFLTSPHLPPDRENTGGIYVREAPILMRQGLRRVYKHPGPDSLISERSYLKTITAIKPGTYYLHRATLQDRPDICSLLEIQNPGILLYSGFKLFCSGCSLCINFFNFLDCRKQRSHQIHDHEDTGHNDKAS